MRTFFCLLFVSLVVAPAHAIPNSFFGNGNAIPIIPAFPRFNAELTEEFLEEKNWSAGELPGPWEKETSLGDSTTRRMAAMPVLFGEVPMKVLAYSDGAGVEEIAIHFLDAGMYFGYRFGGEKTRDERETGRERRHEFSRHFKGVAKAVRERLEDGCGRGTLGAIGRTRALRTEFTEYRWEDFVLRLVEREDHSVSLHIHRRGTAPAGLADPRWLELGRRDRQARLEEHVSTDNGAPRVTGLPVSTQGLTPFCGIHSLAIVAHHIGLRASPEALAAGAAFENTGSAGGSDLIGLHRAVAEELDMRVSIAPKFDPDRVGRSIEDGLPVIVWRRVTAEREKRHAAVARSGSGGNLAPLEPEELEKLPERDARGTPSHASVVTGIDPERGIVHYTEPWGETGRDRVMRLEEMAATGYAVFFFRL
ncbi:MAG: hypothetical protein WD342_08090 [Verrucomicrobiales bacterium]